MAPIITGIGWDLVGAASAASFYFPLSKVRRWSWETTWCVAGAFSWILLPILVTFALLPHPLEFFRAMDPHMLLVAFLFGAMWGIGNVSYGLTIRYLGMSLGIGVATGIIMAVGTLLPPVMRGHAADLVQTRAGLFALGGTIVALFGIAVVTMAGNMKERMRGYTRVNFNVRKGLMLAILSGVFSSGMSLAIDAAQPIRFAALNAGVKSLYAGLPAYAIIMTGGAAVNFAYCIIRLIVVKDLSLKADLTLPVGNLFSNALLAATGGIMWYLQFFFMAWGGASIPAHLAYVNWMLLMSGCVLCAAIVGLAAGEWGKIFSKPVGILALGMLLIVLAANLVGLGMAY